MEFSYFSLLFFSLVNVYYSFPLIRTNNELNNTNRGLLSEYNGYELEIWPGGKVYYQFDSKTGNDLQTKVRADMAALTKGTMNCITFKEDKTKEVGYLKIFQDEFPGFGFKGCFTEPGYRNDSEQNMVLSFGKQNFSCESDGNGIGIAVHELMHSLGFSHEFQRNDRDKYIILDKEKIKKDFHIDNSDYSRNFDMEDNDPKGLPFNFKSIMNYNLTVYVNEVPNPKKKPIGNKKNLGQVCAISTGDLNLIELTYFKECRKGKKPKPMKFDKPYKIPGVDCKNKIKVDNDQVDVEPKKKTYR